MTTPPPNQPPPWGQQPQPPRPTWGQPQQQPAAGWQPPPGWGQQAELGQQQPTPKSNKRTVYAVTVGVAALLAIGVIANITDKHAGDTAAAPAPAPARTSTTPAAPANPAPATTAAPSPSHNADYETGQKIAAWYAGGGKDKMMALGADGSTMGVDASALDVIQLTADCGTLKGHVRDAQAYQPIPDDQAQQHWAKALADYKKAADDCIAGASAVDASKINQANEELTAGTTEVTLVSARISEISAAAQ